MEGADPPQGGGIRVALAKGGGRRDTSDPSPAQATEGEPVEEEVDFDFGGDLDEAERDAWDVLVDGHADGDTHGGDWYEGGGDAETEAGPTPARGSDVPIPDAPEPAPTAPPKRVHDPNFRRLYGVMVPVALRDGGSDADVLAWARADCKDWTYEPDEEEAALMRELERMEDGDFEGIDDEVPTEAPLVPGEEDEENNLDAEMDADAAEPPNADDDEVDFEPSQTTPMETEEVPIEAKLDFTSPHFDPLFALREGVKGAFKPPRDVRPLDYVGKFRGFLPKRDPHFVDYTAPRKGRSAESIAAQAAAKERAMRFKAKAAEFATREKVIDVLAAESRARGGPLSVLVKAFDEGRRVRVATRHRTGIRGVATAYVKAFDVYMNMVLQDVQETYSVRLRHTVEDPKRPGRTRVKYALEQRSRHMNQVFLRGEQVVTVAVEKDGDDFDDDEEEEEAEEDDEDDEDEDEEEKPRRGKVKSRGIDPVEEVGAAADEEPVQRFGAEITRARRARQTEQGGGAARGAWNPPPPPRPPAGRPPPPRPPPPRPPPGRPPPPRPPPGPPPGRR